MIKKIIFSLVVVLILIGCSKSENVDVKSSTSNINNIYNKLSKILVWDGVAGNGKYVSLELYLKDQNNDVMRFENVEIPLKVKIYTETSAGSKQKERLVYEGDHYLKSSSNPFIKIPKEEIDYTTKDKRFGITVVEIQKPNGHTIIEETTNLPLHILLK